MIAHAGGDGVARTYNRGGGGGKVIGPTARTCFAFQRINAMDGSNRCGNRPMIDTGV